MSVIELHDLVIVGRGGVGELPPPGTVFSGAVGETLEDAAAFVPHGTIRVTTPSTFSEPLPNPVSKKDRIQ